MPSPKPAAFPTGLTSAEAATRLAKNGPNQVQRERSIAPATIFFSQFTSPVVWLLLGACVVAAMLAQAIDAIAIGSIVVINALVGFFQG